MTPKTLLILGTSLALLGGCKKEEPTPPPFQSAAKVAPPAPAPTPEPPPFTPADSGASATAKPKQAAPEPPPATPSALVPSKSPVPSKAPATDAPTPAPQGEWVLQVGSRSNKASADASVDRLKAKGFPAYVLDATGTPTANYRIRIGAFASREEAMRYGTLVLKPAGIKEFWADKKSNEAAAKPADKAAP